MLSTRISGDLGLLIDGNELRIYTWTEDIHRSMMISSVTGVGPDDTVQRVRNMVDHADGWVTVQTVPIYAPHYATFEEWVAEFVGLENIVLQYVPDNGTGDRCLWLYDGRPETPLPEKFWTDEDRKTKEEDGIDPDPVGGNFGYVVNLDTDWFSEWGIAPYPRHGQTQEQYVDEFIANLGAMASIMGDDLTVIDVTRPGENLTLGQWRDKMQAERDAVQS